MVLTVRDKKLMSMISEMGFMTTSQLNRTVFKKISITTQLRRLRILESTGYISRIEGLENNEKGWRLTLKGAEVIGCLFCKRKFNKSNLHHDRTLVDLRLLLEDQSIAHSWVPEHEIRSKMARSHGLRRMQFQNVPDGIMGVDYQGLKESVAIELELSLKNKSRYKDIFWSYRFKDRLQAVWYLVPTKKFGESLSQLWNSHIEQDSRLWFLWSVVDDVLENGSQALIYYNHQTTKIEDLWTRLPAQEGALGMSTFDEEIRENKIDVSNENQDELPLKAS